MSYDLTLAQVKNSSIARIAGVCVDSDEFVQTLNDVTRRLMNRGNWFGQEQLFRMCLYGCKLVWPRQIGTILGVRFCCNGIATLRNGWWASYGSRPCGWGGNVVVRDDGTRPCHSEVSSNTGKFIKYHVVKIQDVGKTIRLFGFQYGNQPLQELDANGNWVPGITLTATQAGVQSTVLVTKIDHVIREATQGRTFLYEVDPTTAALRDLATYEPTDTNPSWRCSVVQGWRGIPFSTDTYDRHVRQVEVLAKVAFVPVVHDDDFVLIGNLEALRFGFQAQRLTEADDDERAEAKFMLAIKELNMDLRDKNPRAQIAVSVNSISSDYVICQPI